MSYLDVGDRVRVVSETSVTVSGRRGRIGAKGKSVRCGILPGEER